MSNSSFIPYGYISLAINMFQERKQIMDLLNEQQETEQNELSHQLELEQKEQLEKIRKVSFLL